MKRMKKSTKIISLILSVVMVFSILPVFASANVIENVDTIENLIKNENLAKVVTNLVKDINKSKDAITGTILRIVLIAMKDNEDIKPSVENKDISKFSDEEAAKIVVDWINKVLAENTKDINENQIVQIINRLGITVDLGSIDKVYATLKTVRGLNLSLSQLGDLNDLNVDAVKDVTVAKNGNLGVIKAAIQFLEDNLSIITKFITGKLQFGNLKIPPLIGFDVSGELKKAVGPYVDAMAELPYLIKSFLYKAIDTNAAPGKFEKGATKGDWGNSAYKDHTADELLGAALIKLIKGGDGVISKAEAAEATGLSFYGILSKYAKDLYNRFAIGWLNDNLQGLIEKICVTDEIKARFNQNIAAFDENTFNDVFAGAQNSGFLGQFNNLVVRIAELVLTPAAYTELALEKGGNDKLNANILKICRYALPVMANKTVSDKIGFDFTPFTAEAVKNMELGDMVVAILKPFFGGWFSNATNEALASVKNVRQLGAYALYLTATNPDWDWVKDIDYDFAPFTAKLFDGNTVKDIDDATAKDLIISLGAGIGIGALKHNKDKIYFNVDVDNDWQKAAVQISNWALGFIKGMPAVVLAADLMNADDYGPFYKINVVLNELIDFSFLNDVNTENFKLDLETLLNDAVLGNLFECDLAGVIHVFEKNEKEGNILNAPVIPSVIGAVDRIITALFEHADHIVEGTDFDYDEQSGYIVPKQGPDYMLGDVDKDEKITASDARLALRRAVDLEDYAEGSAEFLACDVDKDSKVTAGDARIILRAAVGLEEIAA